MTINIFKTKYIICIRKWVNSLFLDIIIIVIIIIIIIILLQFKSQILIQNI